MMGLQFLPGTGRGTIRRMVKGSRGVLLLERAGMGFDPSASLTAATSPFPGGPEA